MDVVIAMVLVGGLLGAALYALIVYLAPPSVSALVQLGRLDAREPGPHGGSDRSVRAAASGRVRAAQTRLGQLVIEQLARWGVTLTRLRQDLALAGQDLDTAMGVKVLCAVGGLLLGLLFATGITQGLDLTLPPGAPLLFALAAAAGLFVAPDVDVRRKATRRRAELRHDLGIYLDLVALEMAGAAAPAEALPSAAALSPSWTMTLLRDTIASARLAGHDQWEALSALGERIGIEELRDLGALIRLVAHDGARVRQTLIERAASIRARELAEAKGKAGENKQTMQLAQTVIGFAFIVFLLYPALKIATF